MGLIQRQQTEQKSIFGILNPCENMGDTYRADGRGALPARQMEPPPATYLSTSQIKNAPLSEGFLATPLDERDLIVLIS
ncbi:hypothetical protein CEXT_240481 [Caerostris extrusa]|uniref:Uncharacterized protein n=1 Tax=Caerostris extrusa TaxID=172846 RepID=A0AAV4WG07_CAEEX|nr:hypothetical protein CEXT_240481 [Caerostris extrusa]